MNTQIVCDLHLHSKYSRAVSPQMVVSEMARWAKLKGIDILGTGDFTHPLWLREIKGNLKESEEGLYSLIDSDNKTKFLLTAEISSIYSQGGKGRRIHNLVLAPSIETVEKINKELMRRGCNLMSDGRPIIGIKSRDLVEIILGIDANCMIVPCHVWTPWFSLYGSESGFDSILECYGDMSKYIYAIETGLSSSPEMNWRIKELGNRSILSNSDSHSGAKLGRETTVLRQTANGKRQTKNNSISFKDIIVAIKREENCEWEIGYTTEFYPEEGKYHFTGHRNCLVRQSPQETKKLGIICPKCGKRLTIGVMHRVEQLASWPEMPPTYTDIKVGGQKVKMITSPKKTKTPYVMLVPLVEILAEAMGSTTSSVKVIAEYNRLINIFGTEFNILLTTPISDIEKSAGERIGEGIKKVREGDIVVDPGYDGTFGVVKIWNLPSKKSEIEKNPFQSPGDSADSMQVKSEDNNSENNQDQLSLEL